MKKSILLFLLYFLSIFAFSQEIYITPNGSADPTDSDAGTQANPYDLQTGLIQASDGDTVLLDGIFLVSTNIFVDYKNDLIIRPVDGGNASIEATESLSSGGNIFLFTLNDSDNITIQDITFKGSQDVSSNGFWMLNLGRNNNLTIDNLTFERNWGQDGVALWIFGNGNNITVQNSTIKDMGWSTDPNDTPITGEVAISSGMIIQGNENAAPFSNVLIENNTIKDMISGFAENITLTGNVDGFTIRGNTLSDTGNIGIALAGHYESNVDPVTNMPIEADKNQARNGAVTGNQITRAISPIATSAGIYCDGCRDVIIQRNVIKESGAGISIGCENGGGLSASNVTVINNILKENVVAGLFLGSSLNSDNQNEAQSIVENSIIRNNVFYKNGTNTSYSLNQEAFIGRSNNTEFFNNILYIDNNSQGIISAALTSNGNPTFQEVTNFTLNHNLYYRDNGNTDDFVVSFGSTLPNPQNAQFDNPEFIDPLNDNFRIPITSIAANTGSPSSTILTDELDFYGNNRLFGMTDIDIGAYESESTLSTSSLNLTETIKIYPTLVKDGLTINFENPTNQEITISIYNLNGLKMMSSKSLNASEINILDLKKLSGGLYILELQSEGIRYKQKIIKL